MSGDTMGERAMVQRVETLFGEMLKQHRARAGLTQEDLAERAGVSARAISDLERGINHRPHAYTIQRLIQALDLQEAESQEFAAAARVVGERHTEADRGPQGRRGQSSSVQTFLIADIRDYTRYTEEQGDEAAAHLAERFAALCRAVVTQGGGEVIELRGDEALAVFDSPRQAMRTAIDLQTRLAHEQEGDSLLPLRVGMGLDVGEAVSVQGGYRGGVLNLAALLCGLAKAGEVLCSERVASLARKTDGIMVVDRGRVRLKGLPEPVRVLQIGREGELPTELPSLHPVEHATNLPEEPTPFIGRAGEIGRITALLREDSIRLVTLTGPGGTGKTRLALQAARALLQDFRDGVFFVSLAALSDPTLVPSAIAEVVGAREEGGTDILRSLTEHLGEKQLLLVLDNLEHLLDACEVVSSLLDACRELHVLVTSRTPLRLRREHEHAVPPLAVPNLGNLPTLATLQQYESVALFIERARAARDSFAITDDNAAAIAEICVRLDGLPLAIELAAARVKLFPPAALLQRLSSRLQLLTGGARDLPSRQRTLRGAIDWSYSLLAEDEQVLFARLSVFAGGCTFDAAEAVCNPDGRLDLLEGMASLVDQSLLRQEGEEPRFGMLETIREYAQERLHEQSERETVREAHAGFFLSLVAETESKLIGPTQGAWLDRLEGDLDNVRAAMQVFLEGGEVERELRLAAALYRFWWSRGFWREGQRWLEEGLAVGKEMICPGTRAKALSSLGSLTQSQGDLERATVVLGEALRLFRQLDNRKGCARALNSLGVVALDQGQYERAAALLDESLCLAQELGDRERSGAVLSNLGMVALQQGDLVTGKARYREALPIHREIGDTAAITLNVLSLGSIAQREGDLTEAEARFEEALSLAREQGLKRQVAIALGSLGEVAAAQGKLEQARELLRESLLLARDMGARSHTLGLLEAMAQVDTLVGEAQRTAWLEGAAATLRKNLDIPIPPSEQAANDETLAQARAMLGEGEFARAWERGQAASLEEAVAYALGESE